MAKTSRIELRATPEDRELMDRAAAALGTDRSSFVLACVRSAVQRVLADRQHFVLDPAARQEWERINNRPARNLSGLARLMDRPLPFSGSVRRVGGCGTSGPRPWHHPRVRGHGGRNQEGGG